MALAHRRPGHAQAVGELDLVLQPAADRQLAVSISSCRRLATWKYSGTGLVRSSATSGERHPSRAVRDTAHPPEFESYVRTKY